MRDRRPVVGVMGSGVEPHEPLATAVGTWIARSGWHLLTGGGAGVMAAVSAAYVAVEGRAGLCLGVLPGAVEGEAYRAPEGYPNPHLEVVIRTHLPGRSADGLARTSRNHINVLSADLVVALPGGAGTRSEVVLALRYGRPVMRVGPEAAFVGFPEAAPRVEEMAALDAWARRTLASRGAGHPA
ncbi:MAG: molybdenum cofactor carrier protein [Sandaracinaceae bacterium]